MYLQQVTHSLKKLISVLYKRSQGNQFKLIRLHCKGLKILRSIAENSLKLRRGEISEEIPTPRMEMRSTFLIIRTGSQPLPPLFKNIKLLQYYCTNRAGANMQGTRQLDSIEGNFSQRSYHSHSHEINKKQES